MPMPLMGRKPLTPQEIYKARKQREEEERNALLPPGLVNHGNTCFMNSVLQGLIATPMLYDLVRFKLPDRYIPLASRRSPQLTNGHGNAGEFERKWEEGMPLGDIFVMLMNRAWATQEERQRINLSPKEILNRLGKKYDQYLDFRQQDAHELLRHLLDATRMEEFDIIKKRQPRPKRSKRRKSDTPSNLESSVASLDDSASKPQDSTPDEIPEDQLLTSFVDMAFGGQLASVLVCDKCKKVSMTFEDFEDLSLPIKAEDYERVRRRDRLKTFAKKLRIGGLDTSSDQPRSSSTPASPTRKSIDPEKIFERSSISEDRRRSLDAESVVSGMDTKKDGAVTPNMPSNSSEIPEKEAGFQPAPLASKDASDSPRVNPEGKAQEKGLGRDDPEGWQKLSRHISMRLGRKGRGKEPRKGKEKDSSSQAQSANSSSAPSLRSTSRVTSSDAISTISNTNNPPTAPPPVPSLAFPRPLISRAHSASPTISMPETPAVDPPPVLASPPTKDTNDRRSASPLARGKSPQPPSLSRQETEYLRRLLTDVPSSAALPFSNLFRSTASLGTESGVGSSSSWAKFGGVQNVEDCLRMFTAVEVLDGENRYGCRRCWKMANGTYVERGRALSKHFANDDSSSEEEENPANDSKTNANPPGETQTIVSPALSATLSGSPLASSADLSETASFVSAPGTLQTSIEEREQGPSTAIASVNPLGDKTGPSNETPTVNAPHLNMEVPVISMTEAAPDTPIAPSSDGTAATHPLNYHEFHTLSRPLVSSPSRDSLKLPEPQHIRQSATHAIVRGFSTDSSNVSSEDSDIDIESDIEMSTASVQSETSSMASQDEKSSADKETKRSNEILPTVTVEPPRSSEAPKSKADKAARAKQVIPRRAFKRYLIAKAPPVLVIHLKRFQQVGKPSMYTTYFSNLKKLDDNVAFPEYLDLTPFLLPKKEEYGLSKDAKAPVNVEKCMYRLYAVVVHIGNMLGGHYIAYTALPDSSLVPNEARTAPSSSTTSEERPPQQASDASITRPSNSRTNSFQTSADPKAKPSQASSRKWCYISDTVVKLTTLEEVMKSKAYICMYERI
ncbi:cysteine proteinase [Schizopora paradoxa]|uniref:ubiquitinyl hydrolase 1 n=1 Tax=Schizopora paradoxa TaxID=27342 RepID=A0A0H2R879_9AGAM|nr:cysteine proteinase [Schizopora paradoxa]